MDQSSLAIQVRRLSWGVPGRAILDDVSLEVATGEFVALVGPNGSGKTSLLRCLYRHNRPTSGYVRLLGKHIWETPAMEVARLVAAVTQESPDAFDFTVEEVVMIGRVPHRRGFGSPTQRDHDAVNDALREVDATHLAGRLFSTLSGGEKQRVLIARALAQEAEILLLDEPTNNLDVRHQFEILELMRSLPQTKVAVLHDLNLAMSYGSRVCVLDHGSIVADGPVDRTLSPELIREVFGVSVEIAARASDGGRALLFAPGDRPGERDR